MGSIGIERVGDVLVFRRRVGSYLAAGFLLLNRKEGRV